MPSLREGRAGTEVEASEEHPSIGLLFMACSVSFLKHPRTSHPGLTSPAESWALPRPSLIKKASHWFAYRPILWRNFLHCASCFSDISSLYEVDKKPNQDKFIRLESGAYGAVCGQRQRAWGQLRPLTALLEWRTRKRLTTLYICLSRV